MKIMKDELVIERIYFYMGRSSTTFVFLQILSSFYCFRVLTATFGSEPLLRFR